MNTKRTVVGKDAEKTRQTKSSSYDLTDAYEVSLLNFAEDESHGNYSEFIKRLIGQEMFRRINPTDPVAVIDFAESISDDREVMSGYL